MKRACVCVWWGFGPSAHSGPSLFLSVSLPVEKIINKIISNWQQNKVIHDSCLLISFNGPVAVQLCLRLITHTCATMAVDYSKQREEYPPPPYPAH